MIKAGDLRTRFDVQAATDNTAADGSSTRTWATSFSRWGSIRGLSGREMLAAGGLRPEYSHTVVLRLDTAITAKNRLVFGSRIFEIVSINDFDNRHEYMLLLVNEVTA